MTTTGMPIHKYRAYPPVALANRQWPSRQITQAPRFVSVDLRDGNQALVEPMGLERKIKLWHELVRMGFKEIEVAFPAASQPDYDFVRHIIEHDLIPEDVTIQVLTQARNELIDRTFEALRGVKRAIVHLYNSTSTLQRRVVFGLPREGIIEIATRAAARVKQLADAMQGSEISLEYSPESFTGTELDFAKEICEAVMDIWQPTPTRKIIINLPSTVEMATPNIYADQIEWMSTNLKQRDCITLSVHPHNDRGTAVAAAELGVMAGADRVEGCLFGNGERTGNVDIVTVALNLFSQGVEPTLDIRDIDALKALVEEANRLPVHPRHPYAGELVYTSFSGSHQDAIKKGFAAMAESNSEVWEIPYLPIDPHDVGRSYEAVIRVNSQSGKGGVAFLLEQESGYVLPRALSVELSQQIQGRAERDETEISPKEIAAVFTREYIERKTPIHVVGYRSEVRDGSEHHAISADIDGVRHLLSEAASGPIDAFVQALSGRINEAIEVESYSQHALEKGSKARAVAYVCVRSSAGARAFGVGVHESIVSASLAAVASAVNRLLSERDILARAAS
jgi:2-isopropylmalate synthase